MALILIPDNVRGMLEHSHATVSLFTLCILYIILQYLLLLLRSTVYKYYYSTYYFPILVPVQASWKPLNQTGSANPEKR